MNYQMTRRSDGRKMLVSTAEKVISGKTLGDTDLLAPQENMAAEAVLPV